MLCGRQDRVLRDHPPLPPLCHPKTGELNNSAAWKHVHRIRFHGCTQYNGVLCRIKTLWASLTHCQGKGQHRHPAQQPILVQEPFLPIAQFYKTLEVSPPRVGIENRGNRSGGGGGAGVYNQQNPTEEENRSKIPWRTSLCKDHPNNGHTTHVCPTLCTSFHSLFDACTIVFQHLHMMRLIRPQLSKDMHLTEEREYDSNAQSAQEEKPEGDKEEAVDMWHQG